MKRVVHERQALLVPMAGDGQQIGEGPLPDVVVVVVEVTLQQRPGQTEVNLLLAELLAVVAMKRPQSS